jgi:hypothetical protein
MWPKARKNESVPKLAGTYYKFMLKVPLDVHVSDPDAAPCPNPAPAANISNREPYVLMHMPKSERQTQVVVPEPTAAVDIAQTPVDAPSTGPLGAASEITPDEFSEEVTGLVERLSLLGAAASFIAGAGAGDSDGVALGKALALKTEALKTEGNQHFSAGDYSQALPLYSEAIEMLGCAGENAALAILLCNRSVTYLKLSLADSALTDAERSRVLGGKKAHFRRAEALLSLGRYEEALEAFEAALTNAVSNCASWTRCF